MQVRSLPFLSPAHLLTLSVMISRIVDAVTDHVEDGEAGSLEAASPQHTFIFWRQTGELFGQNLYLGKSLAQELKTMRSSVTLSMFLKKKSW